MSDRLTVMARAAHREVKERKRFGGVSNAALVRHFENLREKETQ